MLFFMLIVTPFTLFLLLLLELEPDYVKWPTPYQMAIEESKFYSQYGMLKMEMINFNAIIITYG